MVDQIELNHLRQTRRVFMDVLVLQGALQDSLLAMQHVGVPPADTNPEKARELLPWNIHYLAWDCWRRLRLEHDRLVRAGVMERVL